MKFSGCMSTAIPCRTYPVSSAPGSQATSGPVSTWMGDRLGIRDAVGIILFPFLSIALFLSKYLSGELRID